GPAGEPLTDERLFPRPHGRAGSAVRQRGNQAGARWAEGAPLGWGNAGQHLQRLPPQVGGGPGGVYEGVRAVQPHRGGAGYAASVLISSALVLMRLRSVSRSVIALIGVMPAIRWRKSREAASPSPDSKSSSRRVALATRSIAG